MSATVDISFDFGILGDKEFEFTYYSAPYHAGGFDEPPSHEEFYIEKMESYGVDIWESLSEYEQSIITDKVKSWLRSV